MDKIAILDCGGQYAHLIGNRVRRLRVYSEILPVDVDPEELTGFKGVILSGGPQSVYEEGSPQCNPGIFELGIPMLGICYGEQLMIQTLGGKVEPGEVKEYGPADLSVEVEEGGLFDGFDTLMEGETTRVWMSHGDKVTQLPEGFEIIGSTPDCENAAVADKAKKLFGVQYHLEVTHSEFGMEMLDNFIELCGCQREWSIDNYIEQQVAEIQQKVGNNKVFLLISGGVDSTVAFLLIDKALGEDNVYGLFVDTGFMRKGERDEVEAALRKVGFKNLHVYDASEEYFEALDGVYEPEKKRAIIGKLFLDIQAKVVKDLGLNPDEWILGQGTIYPDTIESGRTKHAATIKTHHNRVPEIEELIKQGKVIEPLEQLYKDEVREVGRQLGLEAKIVERHPFPGPGLAVRCLCAEGEDYPENHEDVEKEINEFLANEGGIKMTGKILPIKSVGVQGDARTYRHCCALMTEETNWQKLDEISTKLTNRFAEINRVVLAVNPNHFNWVTVDAGFMDRERIGVLQEADKVVNDFLWEKDIYGEVWQFPTVLIPVAVDHKEGFGIVLRPVCSQEAMTANFYEMKADHLSELAARLHDIEHVTGVFYDISHKPPGTIEWE